MVPVLFEFVILDPMSHFYMNKQNYSAFPYEREVLLQDGLSCTMTGIKKSMNSRLGQSLTIIQLTFPEILNESEDNTQKSESKMFDFDERKSSNAAAIPERNLPKQMTRSSLQSPREFPVIMMQTKRSIVKKPPAIVPPAPQQPGQE